ncbi:MAG TPA: 1-deoxy-D-xylulose-5-phosphate reductoisomerase [Gemmatimonadales bacterium]|jgi:1-deoxy-D-xylulose-5-phosphate reductoisomerase|nr:1-deoxy-D-xylulose-5-phosphate reductoisomerase [Gemmatimonadales bacterium]
MRGVVVLGSTGSIGRSTLEVLRRQRDHFRVVALTGGKNTDLLRSQADEFAATYVAVVGEPPAGTRMPQGPSCLVEAATLPEADIVVNAVVGAAGLDATLAALRAGKRVALANKESLVLGGELIRQAARDGGGELIPVDSEHSAVLQCLAGREEGLARLIITASGGPFREWPAERVASATVQEALRHPTWKMGNKVTVDSATLANKALELIEAHFLFDLSYDALEVVVHPQSVIHAFVEFCDGSVIAQLAFPSMELPILYALTYPGRLPDHGVRRFDPVSAGPFTFEPVRTEVFRAFRLGVGAGRTGGTAPAVFNSANEVAVAAFLAGEISFGQIPDLIERALDEHQVQPARDLATVREADRWARTLVRERIG